MATSWTVADIPDLSGINAVLTGADSGIGLEVTRGLAAKGAHVILAVRRIDKGEAAASAIRATSPGASLEVLVLDLADLAAVHRFAETLGPRLGTLALLINNAGVGSASLQRTLDGFELDFGTNHLGHFALTGLLLPMLLASPQARVVTVTSMAHSKGDIDFDNLDGSKGFENARAYFQSKLANILFAYELQRRLTAAGAEVLSVAAHPGWAATNMTVGSPEDHPRPVDRLLRFVNQRFAPSAAHGARPILFAATSADARGGDYIGPEGLFGVWGSPARVHSSNRSHDEDLARQLWNVSETLTGVRYSFVRDRSFPFRSVPV